MSGESRVDLLNWVNDLLNLNYTKVEQLGTGAAYCQIMDSIFLDVPMGRVKFDTTKEYEYLNNFKVLQATFVRHKIPKTIPVERLIKCKFQDNLEFFQWIRKFWKENKDESDYDPNSRRKYIPPPPATPSTKRTTASTSNSTLRTSTSASSRRVSSTSASSRHVSSTSSVNSNPASSTLARARGNSSSTSSSRVSSRVSSLNKQTPTNKDLEQELLLAKSAVSEVTVELDEYKNAVEALETERNFYFNKLREIEILTETTSDELKAEVERDDLNLKDTLIKIQEILYSTEEGFQIPEDHETNDINMEEETF